jgi:hypothetical protein
MVAMLMFKIRPTLEKNDDSKMKQNVNGSSRLHEGGEEEEEHEEPPEEEDRHDKDGVLNESKPSPQSAPHEWGINHTRFAHAANSSCAGEEHEASIYADSHRDVTSVAKGAVVATKENYTQPRADALALASAKVSAEAQPLMPLQMPGNSSLSALLAPIPTSARAMPL